MPRFSLCRRYDIAALIEDVFMPLDAFAYFALFSR